MYKAFVAQLLDETKKGSWGRGAGQLPPAVEERLTGAPVEQIIVVVDMYAMVFDLRQL